MAYKDDDLLTAKILDAIRVARRKGELEIALSLAMAHEVLTRDQPMSKRQICWPIEIRR